MVLWTAGILAALGLCWLVGAVVAPVWRASAVVKSCVERGHRPRRGAASFEEDLDALGGPGRAARALALYLRMPQSVAPDRSMAILLLGECGEPAVPALIRELRSPSAILRGQAARQLGRIGPPASPAIPALRKLLEEREADENIWTYRGQGSLGSPVYVSEEAQMAIGRIEDRLYPEFLRRLKGGDRSDRHWAMYRMAELEDPRAVPHLMAALGDGDAYLREAAAVSLGRFGFRAMAAVPALERAAGDPEAQVRDAARRALAEIRR